MGAGSSCGGLGGKAGPHTSTVIGTVIAVAATRGDIPEPIVVAIRGTKPPPHRRGHGGMIIGYFTITGFVVIVLCLIILFIAICIASCSEHFKFSKQEQVIGGGRYISLNIAATVGGIIGVLGDIACGKPIMANEEKELYVEAGANISADFCLRAKGDSMIGARIYDGDIVFIKKQEMVDNGEIAAVIIEDEATLKRVNYFPEKNLLILKAENSKYEDLVYTGEQLDHIIILGKAVAFQSDIR